MRLGAGLLKNAAANLSRLATGWLAVLIMPPILVRTLAASTYATWMLILQIAAYSTIFESALQMATARFVAQADGLGDRRAMGKMVSTSALLLTGIGTFVLVAVGVIAWNFGRFFSAVPAAILPQTQWALVITTASLAICLPCSALTGAFIGWQRNEVPALINGSARLFGVCGATWAAVHHHGLVAMALWMAAGTFLQPILYLLAPHRLAWRPMLRIAHLDRQSFVEFGRFCSASIVTQFSTLLVTGMDLPLVAVFDFKSVAYYSVAATFSNALVVPHGAIVSTVMPVMAAVVGEDSEQRLGQILLRTTRIANALLYSMAFPLVFGMRSLLALWVGHDYAGHALMIGLALVIAQCIRLTLLPYALVGFSAGQQGRMLASPFAEGLGNLAVSLLLVRSMGGLGVAVGTVCGALLGVLLHFTVSMPRTDAVRFSKSKLLFSGIVLPAIYLVPIAAAFTVLVRLLPGAIDRSVILFLSEIALLCSFWFSYFTAQERTSMRGLLHRKPSSTRAAGI